MYDIDPTALAVLLRAAHADRCGALDELIRMSCPVVERHARRHAWRNTDPDDIVQEVWVRLIQNIHRIREPRALLGWLSVVTRRLALELGHRNARLVPTELDDGPGAGAGTEEDAVALQERREITAAIQRALDRLDAADRRLLMLLNEDGPARYRDVGAALQRPVGSLGPTRRRLLDRLSGDPALRHLRPVPAAS